jgi:hypothetical protein
MEALDRGTLWRPIAALRQPGETGDAFFNRALVTLQRLT